MNLPCESNYSKSVHDLVHELEINHERVNASAEGARKLFLESERLKVEQGRQAELYVLALRERRELRAELDKANTLAGTVDSLKAAHNHALELLASARGELSYQVAQRLHLVKAVHGSCTRKQLRQMVDQWHPEPREL